MSCYQVSRNHTLLIAAILVAESQHTRGYYELTDDDVLRVNMHANQLSEINCTVVNNVYAHHGMDCVPETFNASHGEILSLLELFNATQKFKLIDGYTYQCIDSDAFEQSDLYAKLNNICVTLARSVPHRAESDTGRLYPIGYDNAPWSI